jgi:DNA polymerase I
MLPELCGALGFYVGKAPGYEADDFLAAAVRAEEARGGTAVLASGDRDTYQLASERTTILFPTRGVSEMTRIGPAEVRERYGVEPAQVPDFIALRGDPSDKLPGAKGVGPKGAADLLRQYASLEDALADGRFAAEADALRLYRRIAQMDADAPIPEVADREPDWKGGAQLVRGWGLNQLADRLEGHR